MDGGDEEKIDQQKLNEACEAQAEFEKYKEIEARNPEGYWSRNPARRAIARRVFNLWWDNQIKAKQKAIEASPALKADKEAEKRMLETWIQMTEHGVPPEKECMRPVRAALRD